MPLHAKPTIIFREQLKPPRFVQAPESDVSVQSGDILSIIINPQTVVTIFGLVNALLEQKVKAELLDEDLNTLDSATLDGVQQESLCVNSDGTTKTVTWGPLDNQTTVELTFYYKQDGKWQVSSINEDKIKEYPADDFLSAISLVPIDDVDSGGNTYQNTSCNITRMTVATDWYVNVNVHNQTPWDLSFYDRYLDQAGTIEKEPDATIPANSTGSGGKFDAEFGPYGISGLICYTSPDPNWRFAWTFVMPYVGSNSCKTRIIDNNTLVNERLFKSMDASSITATSQDMTVDETNYTFTIFCTIGGGTTPTADFYVTYAADNN